MFADCGLCIAYDNALPGLASLRENRCDIAHASRRLSNSRIIRGQPWHRRAVSWLFRHGIRIAMQVPRELTDTQCGFKLYKGDVARDLYSQCTSEGFSFDIEIILRAVAAGYRIAEFPVEWTCDVDSRLSVTRAPWPLLAELCGLKRALAAEKNQSAGPAQTDETSPRQ